MDNWSQAHEDILQAVLARTPQAQRLIQAVLGGNSNSEGEK